MSAERGEDRRRHPRIDILLKIEYFEPQDLIGDYITNLGAGGIFVRTSATLEPGTKIHFNLSFPGLLVPLDLGGIVRWRQQPQHGKEEGLGVEFVFEHDNDRRRVLELIESLQTKAGVAPDRFCVLLVEDNEFARELFSFAVRDLEQAGVGSPLQIYTAVDAQQAIDVLESVPVNLAIVDHYLPGVTGCELVRRVRADSTTAHLPIVMVSIGGERVRQEAQASGVDLYLDKPVLRRQLVETLCALIARQGSRA